MTAARHDAVVIGAGPAGSAAAMLLARAGRWVLLLERKLFPRTKVCGGCLSGPAYTRLRELVGPSTALPGVPGRRVTFVVGGYRLACEPRGATWLATRSELDQCLVDVAVQAGAEVRFGVSATLERSSAGWRVRAGDSRIDAGVVLVATGLGGLPARLGLAGTPARRRLVGQQWTQPLTSGTPALGEVELHWLRGGYIGLATPRPDTCIVALAAESRVCAGAGPYESLRALNPAAEVWSVIPRDAPQRFDACGSGSFPWRPQCVARENVLLIGDAAGFAEPFSGEGISQAFSSATAAAQAVLQGGDVAATYAGIMRQRHRWVLQRTSVLGTLLSSDVVQRLARRRQRLAEAVLGRVVNMVHVTGAV